MRVQLLSTMQHQLRQSELKLVEYPKRKLITCIVLLLVCTVVMWTRIGNSIHFALRGALLVTSGTATLLLLMKCTIDSVVVNSSLIVFRRRGLTSWDEKSFKVCQVKSMRMSKSAGKYITTYTLQIKLISNVHVDTFRSYNKKKITEMYVLMCEYLHFEYNIHKLYFHTM